ncbi:MAG: hypothetical protein Q9169_008197, partial [Polycauliona sp. 2 TL-2023]
YLFEQYYNTDADDVMWSYDNEYRNNNKDPSQSNPGDEDGKDAYGFVMLDGPPGSLDDQFPNTHTITRRSVEIPRVKRSILTSNSSTIDSTFDHSEETIYVYCNHPQESAECQKIWYQGAEDTIIRLPSHVGEGPYARVVSMNVAEPEYELPLHHVEARSLEGNTGPRDEVVNMRVDYTNLLGYWDDLTDKPANKKRKRDSYAEHLSQDQWRNKIGKAKGKHEKLRKRNTAKPLDTTTTTTDLGTESQPIEKRWFGRFLDWLSRLNVVESKELGFLIRLLLLWHYCPASRHRASQRQILFLRSFANPEARTYAYFSLEPSAYLGLRLTGNARLQATTGRKKLLDTISYPGLTIKGIAAVGPTLDLYGEIRGVVTLKGEMRAGARVNFGKAEVYWPQDDAASDKYQTLLGLNADPSAADKDLITPTFDAKVRVDAALDINVTPEANMGLRVGGKISGGTALVDAQLVGYVNSTLRFSASAAASGGTTTTGAASYKYGVYLLFNLGYGAYATVKFFPNWAMKPRNAFNPPKRFTIYEDSGSFTGPTKRSLDALEAVPAPKFPRRGLISGWHGARLSAVDQVHNEYDLNGMTHSIRNQTSALSMRQLLAKRADDDTLPDAPNAVSTAQLQCPAGSTPEITLPDYRLNCSIFQPQQIAARANGQPARAPGICTGVQDFFRKRSLANSQMVLTWDSFPKRSKARRTSVCNGKDLGEKTYCGSTQDRLAKAAGLRKGQLSLSCDEFPFASTEEGGTYLSTLRTNPTSAQRSCVPSWQNDLQGACNREPLFPPNFRTSVSLTIALTEILSEFYTNVGYFERSVRGDQAENWAKWDSQSWLTAGSFGTNGGQPQRKATYPDQQPQPAGISNADYAASQQTLGWNYKRNFTHGMAQPQNSGDGAAWGLGTNEAEFWDHLTDQSGTGIDIYNVDQIACAVNIFGQTEVFKQNWNGQCFNGQPVQSGGMSKHHRRVLVNHSHTLAFERPKTNRCNIDFSLPSGNTKRSIGKFHGWDVTSRVSALQARNGTLICLRHYHARR